MSSKFENKFLDITNVSYRDSKIFSIGGYFIPDASSLTSYWKRVIYRFGLKNEEKSIRRVIPELTKLCELVEKKVGRINLVEDYSNILKNKIYNL